MICGSCAEFPISCADPFEENSSSAGKLARMPDWLKTEAAKEEKDSGHAAKPAIPEPATPGPRECAELLEMLWVSSTS